VLIGLALMALLMRLDYHYYHRWGKLLVLGAIGLLVVVLIPGLGSDMGTKQGVQRWLDFVLFKFQPSEFAKVALVIYLADILSRKHDQVQSFSRLVLPTLIVIGTVFGLVLAQPDFGYAFLLLATAMAVLFVGRVRISHFLMLGVMVFPVLYLAIYHVPYRWQRVMAFLHPSADPMGGNWQLTQSLLGLGSGGILGVGLGQSKAKLFYLPEAHTDFIFSIIGEEMGLLGTLGILAAFMFFAWRGFRIAYRCRDRFGTYLAFGLTFIIVLCSFINVAVASGLFPVTGLPLPFVSYGGSSVVMALASVGILLNISRYSMPSTGKTEA
jgi:cell division protein FtsW